MVDLEGPVALMNRMETKMKAMITSQERMRASQEMKGTMRTCQEKIQASQIKIEANQVRTKTKIDTVINSIQERLDAIVTRSSNIRPSVAVAGNWRSYQSRRMVVCLQATWGKQP
jgi:hypothetical protein